MSNSECFDNEAFISSNDSQIFTIDSQFEAKKYLHEKWENSRRINPVLKIVQLNL